MKKLIQIYRQFSDVHKHIITTSIWFILVLAMWTTGTILSLNENGKLVFTTLAVILTEIFILYLMYKMAKLLHKYSIKKLIEENHQDKFTELCLGVSDCRLILIEFVDDKFYYCLFDTESQKYIDRIVIGTRKALELIMVHNSNLESKLMTETENEGIL